MPALIRSEIPVRYAFTLVEMLVVITVLAILTAVSVSTIGMVKEGSKLAQCSTNLMQISQAIQGYANDWNGFLPNTDQLHGEESGFAQYLGHSSDGITFDIGFQQATTSKCPKVWEFYSRFPGNSSSSPTVGRSGTANWHINAMYAPSVNFAMNGLNRAGLEKPDYNTRFDKILKINHIVAKSMCALMFDGDARWNNVSPVSNTRSGGGVGGNVGGVKSSDGAQFMHSSPSKMASFTSLSANSPVVRDGKTNVLFADGGVRALAYTSAAGNFDENKTMICAAPSAMTGQNAGIRKKYQLFWNYVGEGGWVSTAPVSDRPSGWAP